MCSQFLAFPSSINSVVSFGDAGLMNEAKVFVIRRIVGGAADADTLIRWCAALIILWRMRTFRLKSGSLDST